MMESKGRIKNALISVFYKDGLEPVIAELKRLGVEIYSTGGTQDFIEKLGVQVNPVEELTSYPSILGGRVKTLHPKVFGGILGRRENHDDLMQLEEFQIPEFDLVIVDLYPFEATLAAGASEQEIIEKIDIGGVSLIRAAAKNFKDVLIVASKEDYTLLVEILKQDKPLPAQRKLLAAKAFNITSHYDTAIFNWFNKESDLATFKQSVASAKPLRYGENPHQKGTFFGNLSDILEQLNGKELSYNNLLDVDAAVSLINDFSDCTVAIIKHNNACGLASNENLLQAWKQALAGDPVSAFGGVIVTNREVDALSAEEINKLFFEVLIAPSYSPDAIKILEQKKNRIILKQKPFAMPDKQFRSALNGVLVQDKDFKTEGLENLRPVTTAQASEQELLDLVFANKLVKHTKSNTIVLAKNGQLLASGTGQTSRVDALRQAIAKAQSFGFDLQGAVMASDAFFPFPDCVEIADKAGITAILQPGGSVKDQESIDYCNNNQVAMVFTGTRHFKH